MVRADFFALVGAAFLAHRLVADPGYDKSASQSEWPNGRSVACPSLDTHSSDAI